MAKFNAGDLDLGDLEYDFDSLARRDPNRYPTLMGVKGIIDEPTEAQVQAFQYAMQEATTGLIPDDVDLTNQLALLKAMRAMPREKFEQVNDALVDAVAALCNGSPSRAQIDALPYRHKRKFIQWLQGELMGPEGSTAGTPSSPVGALGG